MTRINIPGGWYIDALPSGEHACLVPTLKHVDTHEGPVACPTGDEPLWLVVTNKPVFRMMGQAHWSLRSLEWWTGDTDWMTLPASCGVWALIYGQEGDINIAKCAPPTGSQGWRYVRQNGTLVTGDATVAVRNGLNERTDLSLEQDGSIEGGQANSGAGVCVWADGKLRLLHAGACFNTRWKWDVVADIVCVSFYDVAQDGIEGWVYRLSMAELKALPPVVVTAPPLKIGKFNHAVLIAPFKDPLGESGAPCEIVVNQTQQTVDRPFFAAEDSLDGPFRGTPIGIYTEGRDDISSLVAKFPLTRLLICHDSTDDWTLPRGMRAWDVPAIEFYFAPGETLLRSVARWERQLKSLALQWPGDLCVIPQFYGMGGVDSAELYTIGQVLNGLNFLSQLVNSEPRVKIVAPFAWQRGNGIVAHPELRAAFASLLEATPGVPTFMPIKTPIKDPPVDPPKPAERFKKLKTYKLGGSVQTERGYLVGAGKKYLRGDASKKGIFDGTFLAVADSSSKNDDSEFELRDRGNGQMNAFHVKSGHPLEMDATGFSTALDKQTYLKPGDGSSPYAMLEVRDDNGTILVYKKYDNEQPVNVAAALVWVKK